MELISIREGVVFTDEELAEMAKAEADAVAAVNAAPEVVDRRLEGHI